MSADKKPLPFVFLWRCHLAMSDVSAPGKAVAEKLSLWMGPDGKGAFPAVWILTAVSGLAERTVRKALAELRVKGWIAGEERFRGGRQTTSTYDATLPKTIANDGINHLHDAEYWKARYDEVERERNRKHAAEAAKRKRKGGEGTSPPGESANPATLAGFADASGTRPLHGEKINPAPQTGLTDASGSESGGESGGDATHYPAPQTINPAPQTINPAPGAPRSSPEGSLKVPVKRYGAEAPCDARRASPEWYLLRDQIAAEMSGTVDRGNLTKDELGQLHGAVSDLARLGVTAEQVHAFAVYWMNGGNSDPFLTPTTFSKLIDAREMVLEVWKDDIDEWTATFNASNGSRLLTVNYGEVPRLAAIATSERQILADDGNVIGDLIAAHPTASDEDSAARITSPNDTTSTDRVAIGAPVLNRCDRCSEYHDPDEQCALFLATGRSSPETEAMCTTCRGQRVIEDKDDPIKVVACRDCNGLGTTLPTTRRSLIAV